MMAVLFAGWVILSSVAVALPLLAGATHIAAFVAGLLVGLLFLFWQYFLLGQGIAQRLIGADAEQWTATELAKLDAPPWHVFHDVPLNRSNVDHVAVGPARVYAVETKWTGSGGEKRFLLPSSRQAQRQAKELEHHLAQLGCSRRVVPLLVVWGGGVADKLGEQPQLWDEVRVVAGKHSDVWLQRMVEAADGSEDGGARHAIQQLLRRDDRAPRT